MKKKINGYLTIVVPATVEVDVEEVEYDYYFDPETGKTTEGNHIEEEYEICIMNVLEQNPKINDFISNYGYDSISFDEF